MCTINKQLDRSPGRTSFVLLFFLLMISCSEDVKREGTDDDIIPKQPELMEIKIPANFPAPVYDLSANQVTKEGFELGKKLFYDARLSRNNTISCGFCHQQSAGFTHHGHDVSHGIDDKLGRRNSLPVQNLIFYKTFFWDGGVHNLELVPLNAIANEVEMDEEVENIIAKLESSADYRSRFNAAFGSGEITSTRFLHAIAQFMAAMISADSRYDRYVRNEGVTFSEGELQGMELFMQHCSSCHATDLFTDQSYRNNGYSSLSDLEHDRGREEITLNPEDRGKFKVPSLRNVAYTAPYMHNGKLVTLEQVLDFYADGVHDTPTLDTLLKANGTPGFDFTEDEKQKIIAFLHTLTDEKFLTDKRFSEY